MPYLVPNHSFKFDGCCSKRPFQKCQLKTLDFLRLGLNNAAAVAWFFNRLCLKKSLNGILLLVCGIFGFFSFPCLDL